MPLRCSSIHGQLNAYDQNEAEWAVIRDTYKTLDLRMPCCGRSAIPKTSSLGTFFFAHSRRGDCTSAPETKEHLLAKSVIAKAVVSAGWEALTESRGADQDGSVWVADVLATKGSAKIAFEVQWSKQADNETRIRQERYKRSDVRGLWLLRQEEFESDQDLPAFRLLYNQTSNSFTVEIKFRSYSMSGGQQIELSDFVRGCLSRKLRWAPGKNLKVPARFDGVEINCWRCKKPTVVIVGITAEISKVLPAHDDLPFSIYDFGYNKLSRNESLAVLKTIIPHSLYQKGRVGQIKMRYSKTEGNEYMSNGCAHCGALQGRFFDHEYAYEAEPIAYGEVVLDGSFFRATGYTERDSLKRWYFSQT